MYARVTTFEAEDAAEIRPMVEGIEQRTESGPPEGVPGVGFLLLHNADEGKVLAIGLFETEADLQQGDATLRSMDPPGGGGVRRASVEMYEVGVKRDY